MSDIFSNTYRPPGIYTEERSPATVNSAISLGTSILAIVGPGVGYQTAQQSVTLSGETPVELNFPGVDSDSVSVTDTSGNTIDPDDYTITKVDGPDGSPNTPDDITSIRRSSASGISDGAVVIVSYHYTSANYYNPTPVTDFTTVRSLYGNPTDAVGNIVSPLSLAAKMAFDNGADRMVLVAIPGNASAVDINDLSDGLDRLLAFESANIIVPLPVGINGDDSAPGDVHTIGSLIKTHLASSENVGVKRMALVGYETGVDVDPSELASTISSHRVGAIWPSRISWYNTTLARTQEIGGYYLAAAAAGRLASLPLNTPLTRKRLIGFQGIPTEVHAGMDLGKKNAWSRNGVMVVEPNQRGWLIIRHGTSTLTTNDFTREISITRAKDALITSIQTSLDVADLIGSPIVAETPVRIKGIVSGVLESMVSDQTIISYSGLDVSQVSVDPSVIEVTFAYRPTYPLNYINIVFSIDPTTGLINEA